MLGCLVQCGNGIELDTVGRQFEPYLLHPCGVTGDFVPKQWTVVTIKLLRISAFFIYISTTALCGLSRLLYYILYTMLYFHNRAMWRLKTPTQCYITWYIVDRYLKITTNITELICYTTSDICQLNTVCVCVSACACACVRACVRARAHAWQCTQCVSTNKSLAFIHYQIFCNVCYTTSSTYIWGNVVNVICHITNECKPNSQILYSTCYITCVIQC